MTFNRKVCLVDKTSHLFWAATMAVSAGDEQICVEHHMHPNVGPELLVRHLAHYNHCCVTFAPGLIEPGECQEEDA
jgi:hypothetical protein